MPNYTHVNNAISEPFSLRSVDNTNYQYAQFI